MGLVTLAYMALLALMRGTTRFYEDVPRTYTLVRMYLVRCKKVYRRLLFVYSSRKSQANHHARDDAARDDAACYDT